MIRLEFAELKKAVHVIAKLKDGKKALEEIKKLDAVLSAPKFMFVKRGYYHYCYEIEYVGGQKKIVDRLGGIESEVFEKEKGTIKAMGKTELRDFIEHQ